MKSVSLAVAVCCVVLFCGNHVSASTYDGTFDPNQLYSWKWEVDSRIVNTNVFLVKAQNPKKENPTTIVLFVEVDVDDTLKTTKKIIAYALDDESGEYYFLDEEKDHYNFKTVERNTFEGECTPEQETSSPVLESI